MTSQDDFTPGLPVRRKIAVAKSGRAFPRPQQASDGPYLLDAAFPTQERFGGGNIDIRNAYYAKVYIDGTPQREVSEVRWYLRTQTLPDTSYTLALDLSLWTNKGTGIVHTRQIEIDEEDTNLIIVTQMEDGASDILYPGLYTFGFKIRTLTSGTNIFTSRYLYGQAVESSKTNAHIIQGFATDTILATDTLPRTPIDFTQAGIGENYNVHPLCTVTFGNG